MKVDDAQILVSDKIDVSQLGIFYKSLYLSNYDFDRKGDVPDEDEDKKDGEDDEEEVDARTKRKTKRLDSFEVLHEEGLQE